MATVTEIQTVWVPVNRGGGWLFVLVHAEHGRIGVGEASHGRGDADVTQWIRALTPQLLGWQVDAIEAFHQRFFHAHEGHTYHTALSGIEQALWDLAGQETSLPAHRLLGGICRNKVRVYANINRATRDRTPQAYAANARRAVEQGFTAIKCAPFDDVAAQNLSRRSMDPPIRQGIERIRQIRASIGPDVDLMVDCHSRFGPALVVQVARELEDIKLVWLEDPVSLEDLDTFRFVNEHTPMPIATGERLRTLTAFRKLLEARAVEYILPDVKYVGGLLGLKKIAILAEAFHVLVTPHNPSGPVAFAASVQCMATVPNFGILEYAWGEVDWRSRLVSPSEEIVDGFAPVPVRPGLGVQLNLSAVPEGSS